MRIAIVGAGIAGLTSAWLLHREHEVTVFEQDSRIGGHTDTHDVIVDGQRIAVDTGFIVFNEHNYPHFCAMLKALGVPWQASDMSFSVNNRATGLSYNPSTLGALLGRPGNLFRPRFWRMLRDLRRFYAQAAALDVADLDNHTSIAAFLDEHGYSEAFRSEHLYPMCGALWSADPGEVARLPLKFVVGFFQHHRMLQVADRPQWLTVKGGSTRYVDALRQQLRVTWAGGACAVERHADHVDVRTAEASSRHDLVIFACHADQAVALLSSLTPPEQAVLPNFRYRPNHMVLHTDAAAMPAARCDWASWQVRVADDASIAAGHPAYCYSYWMNRLQALPVDTPVMSTLNPNVALDPAKVLVRRDYAHPIFDAGALDAQDAWARVNGQARSYFCGAYWGWGFHEDGARSAHRVVEHLRGQLKAEAA